ncbi:SUN domain-containing ossification factor-like isoform X2 [Actinia tenebrosa]|uniref:SUN domain-containing ossification factor-like isoform X2 n=1 Tax=Actinia tenebrosa TaxID=6105 RepID=A0A6P8J564_ACTTE|nr:SUN domain-containing ossification factor-like isoform X2 [Actinia tenebrosa]
MNFRGFLLVLAVFLSVLRICHVENPEVGTGSKPSLNGQNNSLNVEEENEVKSNGELSDSSSSSSSSYTTSSPSSSFSSSLPSSSSPEASTDSPSTFSSKRSISSSELEQLVIPTVAPATPHFDTETITSTSSVIVSVTESSHQEKMPVEEPAPQQEFLLASGIKPEGIKTCKSEEKGKNAEIQESKGAEEKLIQDETAPEKPQEEQSVVTSLPTPEGVPDKKDADSSASVFKDKKEEEPKDIKEDTKDKDEKEETKSKEESKDKEDDSITAELKQAEEETKSTSEEMPSFDEFKRQHLQEEEKQKNILKQQKEVKGSGPETIDKHKPRKIKQRKQNNYASLDCGAKILKANPEASNIFAILQDNRDLYMLNPCSAKIWFIVELCDNVQVKTIEIANFELFSSTPESFKVYVSGRYPTREWTLLGTFQARHERNLQSFPLDEPIYAKYIKVEMLSHFGSEHYCPLTLFRVFGISMMEELEDHEADAQDDADAGDDDDGAQVLPSDPSVKNDENKSKSNILATVGDTLFNIVKVAAKKLTGATDNEKNLTGDSHGTSTVAPPSSIVSSTTLKEKGDKPSIVTLIPSDDEDDKIQDTKQNNKTTNGTSSTEPTKPEQENVRDNTNFYDKIDPDSNRGSKTASAFSSCELFVRMLGHSSFGCMMGKVLYSKRKHHGFTPREESPAKQKTSAGSVKAPPGSDGRTETNTDKGKEDSKKNEEKKEGEKESEKVEEKGKKKGKEKYDENIKEPIVQKEENGIEIISKDETKQKEPSVETKGSSDLNAEKVSKENEQKIINGVVDPVIIVQPSEVQPPIIKPCDASAEKKATPVLKTASILTTHPSGDIKESQSTQTTSSDIEPTLKTLEKSKEEASESQNRATIDDVSKITPDVKDGVIISENTGKESIDTKSTETITSKNEETKTEEGSSASSIVDQSSSGVKDTCTSLDSLDKSIIKPSLPPPSKCKAPSIETPNKDVDVLEFKILDSAGREGTAHLEKPTDTPVKPDKPVPEPDKPVLEKEPIEDTKEEKPDADSQSSSEPSSAQNTSDVTRASPTEDLTVSSSSVEPTKPSVVIPDSPPEPPTNPPDVKPTDSPESISPLSPPPVDKLPIPPPQSSIEASISDDLSSVLSKAPSSATPGAQGLASSGAQKESIFMRLTNRIKALEQNLTLSTLYMEKLNQKYRKIVEDMQKNLDKKVNLLTNATRKAEAVIKSQKEQISALQSKVDDTSRDMKKFSKQLKSLNIQVMERHIIGLFLEVILIMILFIVFRRWDRARIRRDILRESRMNGTILRSHFHLDHTEDRALGKMLNGQLNGREQLQRSFLNPIKPETIGVLPEPVTYRHKEEYFPLLDVKKKRNRKRPKSGVITETNQAKAVSESTNQTPPSSLVSATAGLLFNPTRGLFNGFKRSQSLDDSQSNRKSSLPSTSRLQKTKSMNVTQENTEKNSFSMGNSKKGRIMNR